MPHQQQHQHQSFLGSTNTNELHHMLPVVARLNLDDINDRIRVLHHQEESIYCCRDYLAPNRGHSRSSVCAFGMRQDQSSRIDETCRMKMSQWCYQVVDFAKFRRDTVSIAMNLLDRFLCTHPHNDAANEALNSRKVYQLASMTTLYMAIKIFEPVTMEIDVFTQLSRGCYNADDFVTMEQSVLSALNWRMNGPTIMNFIELYLSVLPMNRTINDKNIAKVLSVVWSRSKYQSELATLNYEFVTKKPSVVAFAAIINSIHHVPIAIFSDVERTSYLSTLEKLCHFSSHSKMVNLVTTKLAMMENQHQSKSGTIAILKPREYYHIPTVSVPSSATMAATNTYSGYVSPNCVSGSSKD